MMKRWIACLLSLVLCFSLVACGNQEEKDEKTLETTENAELTEEKIAQTETEGEAESNKNTPLLYRVTDGDGHVLWLFGSIHVGIEEYTTLPDYVLDAFEGSDSLAVECDVTAIENNAVEQIKVLKYLVYRDGTKIRDHVSEELYAKSVKILEENNLYNKALDSYCPAMWASTISSLLYTKAGFDPEAGVDLQLLSMAKESEKELLEIESVAFQYEMLGSFSEELQELYLEDAVEEYENSEESTKELEKLLKAWASGDEEGLIEITRDGEIPEEETELYEEFNKAMLTDRNEGMTDFAVDALQSGKEVFICVGAAHVVGKGAMVDLLTELGYTVECVTPGK